MAQIIVQVCACGNSQDRVTAAIASVPSRAASRFEGLSPSKELFVQLFSPLLQLSKCQPPSSRNSLTPPATVPPSWSPRLPSSATSCCTTNPPTLCITFVNAVPKFSLKSKPRLSWTAVLLPSPPINPLLQLLLPQTLPLLPLFLFLPCPLHPPQL